MSLPIPKDGSANVYDATADAYVTDIQLDEKLINESPHHEIKLKRKTPKVVLDPLAPDFKDVFVEKGRVMAPDEVLHALRPSTLNIPLKLREDFEDPDALPDSDLLRAIHYYASSSKIPSHSMDETALLALGLLVEQWAEEEVRSCDPSHFMEPDGSQDLSKYVPADSDDNDSGNESEEQADDTNDNSDDSASGNGSSRWSGEESDVMSIDLSDSDTASEVEGGRRVKRARLSWSDRKSGTSESSSSSSSDSSDTESSSSSDTSSSSNSNESSDSDFGVKGFGSYMKSDRNGALPKMSNGMGQQGKESKSVGDKSKETNAESSDSESDSDSDSSSSSSTSSDSSSSDSSSSSSESDSNS